MRNLVGAVILLGLVAVLWKVWPRDAVADFARERAAEARGTHVSMAVARVSAANPLRVLFVGNSHTFMHNLPSMIALLAAADGQPRALHFVMDAPGGSKLAQHVAGSETARLLHEARWDYMVLQEQQQLSSWSQFPEELQRDFLSSIRTLDVIGRSVGAKTVLYMTAARQDGDPDNMPNDTYDAMQDRVSHNYERAASEVGALLAPVGLAVQWAHRARPDFVLWESDRYHPSLAGSYLAACILYQTLYGHSSLGNAFLGGVPEPDARFLQRGAEAMRRP
jgi:hypothetical protein